MSDLVTQALWRNGKYDLSITQAEYLAQSVLRALPIRFAVDEPRQALAQLQQIFDMGNRKHGSFDWKTHHAGEFLIKAERHRVQALLQTHVDTESGCLHIIHSAADLLIAAELQIPKLLERGVLPASAVCCRPLPK